MNDPDDLSNLDRDRGVDMKEEEEDNLQHLFIPPPPSSLPMYLYVSTPSMNSARFHPRVEAVVAPQRAEGGTRLWVMGRERRASQPALYLHPAGYSSTTQGP